MQLPALLATFGLPANALLDAEYLVDLLDVFLVLIDLISNSLTSIFALQQVQQSLQFRCDLRLTFSCVPEPRLIELFYRLLQFLQRQTLTRRLIGLLQQFGTFRVVVLFKLVERKQFLFQQVILFGQLLLFGQDLFFGVLFLPRIQTLSENATKPKRHR